MKRIIYGLSGGLAAVALVCGCSKEAPMPEKTGLAAIDFARIGTETLSAQDVKNMVEVLEKMAAIQNPKRKTRPFGKWSNQQAAMITPSLAYSMALNQMMMAENIEPNKKSDSIVLARYSKRFKRELKCETELLELLGELGPFFHNQFVRESRFEAYMSAHSNRFAVSEGELKSYYRGLTNQVKRCERINAKATAKIEKAWQELKSGVEWNVVATNYTEDAILEPTYADNWYDWVQVTQSGVYNKELASALQTMAAGDFTRPIETEEGVIIVRLTAKEGEVYSLARILVRTAIEVNFPEREAAIKELKQAKIEDFTRAAMSNAASRVKLEFPMGRRITYQIWPEQ